MAFSVSYSAPLEKENVCYPCELLDWNTGQWDFQSREFSPLWVIRALR
jgi:hypothetical protein